MYSKHSFSTFCRKNRSILLLSLSFVLICFGYMLTHFQLAIDEETWILSEQPSLLWLYQNRFSIWLFNLFFTENGSFVPFLWDILSVLLWFFSGILFAWICDPWLSLSGFRLFFFCSYFSSLPLVVGEILSFSMFNFQISLALAATILAVRYTLQYIDSRQKKDALIIILLLTWAFGTYQAFICVFVTAVAALCLLIFCHNQNSASAETSAPALPLLVFCGALFCIISICLYSLINFMIRLLFGSAAYLSESYIGWSAENPLQEFLLSLANVGRISLAIPYKSLYVYGGSVIRFLTVAFLLYVLLRVWKIRPVSQKFLLLFFSLTICIAPFSLYIATATCNTSGRMLLALPITGCIQMLLIYDFISEKRWKALVTAVFSFLLFLNAANMNRLYYYDSLVTRKDTVIADQIMYNMERAGIDYHSKPISFIGMLESDDIGIKTSGTLGGSFWAWDDGNNERIHHFLETLGYKTIMPDSGQLAHALSVRSSMKKWPLKHSIKELRDTIVVYLSDPTDHWMEIHALSDHSDN